MAVVTRAWEYTLAVHVAGSVEADTRAEAEAAALEAARESLRHEPLTIIDLELRKDTAK